MPKTEPKAALPLPLMDYISFALIINYENKFAFLQIFLYHYAYKFLEKTMKLAIICAALFLMIVMPNDVFAQSNRALEQLSQLNRINPLQNPEFETAKDIVGRKIIDRKNKVVGTAEDVIINKNGTIASLKTDLDRLRLGDEINLNYRTMRIRTLSNAYALNMDSDEIVEFYPQLLANIETASGDNADTLSVKNLIDTTLYTKDGRKLGKVENLLFGSNGGIVSAVYAELSYGTLRGDTIAIPFRSVNFYTERGRLRGEIDNDFARAMLKIADN